MRVTMLVDAECIDPGDSELIKMVDPGIASMEHNVAAGLRELGHRVKVLGFPYDSTQAARCILNTHPDVVFNLVEQIEDDRRLSPNVPALLTLLEVPYTGCSEIGMSLSLDKALSKLLVADVGFAIPRFVVYAQKAAPMEHDLRFPVIVKPRFGGGSEGVTLSSVVNNEKQLRARARYIHRTYRQPAICEEFINGRELSVAVLGQGRKVEALPIRETVFGRAAEGGPGFCTETVKRSASYRARWNISYRRAELDAKRELRIRELCCRAFQQLELSGYARMDLRLNEGGKPRFLEANPNPDLRPGVFGLIASWANMDYKGLLKRILELALARRS